jgi:hypothetical protein
VQELVEMIRRDHALLDDLSERGDDKRFREALAAHRALLDQTIAPLVERLDDPAGQEWADARDLLPDVRAHAEQMEQIVLPRLLSELGEEELGDATREVMRRHEELGLGSSRPAAMRADAIEDGDDSSRPAGA